MTWLSLVVPVVVVGVLIAVGWAAVRGGGKVLAARSQKLAEIAASLGLQIRPTPLAHLFSAEGTTPQGVGLRISLDRVVRRGHGGGNRWLLRLVGRPRGPLPAVLVRHRLRGGELAETTPSLHEISTADDAFDSVFVTSVEHDAASLSLLGPSVRAGLLGLGTKLAGVQSLKVGGEVALAVDCTFDHAFFADGRVDEAVALVLRLAAG